MAKEPVQPGASEATSESSDTGPIPPRNVTTSSHQDPEKHYIGDAIGMANVDDIQPVGYTKATGDSVFPSRADHVHPLETAYSRASDSFTGLGLNPTGIIPPLQYLTLPGDEDWTTGHPSYFKIPRNGLYMFNTVWDFNHAAWAGASHRYILGYRISNAAGAFHSDQIVEAAEFMLGNNQNFITTTTMTLHFLKDFRVSNFYSIVMPAGGTLSVTSTGVLLSA